MDWDRRLRPERWRRRQRRRARRLVGLVLGLAVICVVGVVILARHRVQVPSFNAPMAERATHERPLRTTGWLHAGQPWSTSDSSELHAQLAELAALPAFPDTTGILVLDGRDGRVLYSRNAKLALVPGSTVKLITAAAAFSALGPEHRFSTKLVSDGQIDGAALKGNLWLVGGGDPELTSDDLRRGIHELQLAGIGQIDGDVDVDGSRYGADTVSPSWERDDLQYGWAAPASALSLDGGSVQFTITPHPGAQADVAIDPPGERVIASVDTVASDADNTLTIEPQPDGQGYVVRGQIPYGAPQKYWRAIAHPTRATATSLVAMLHLAGIGVSGSAGTDAAPERYALLWDHRSRPLDQIVKHMFALSDNHYAEQLLREVGWKATGLGTLDNSLHAEQTFLRGEGVAPAQAVLADGSGLSDRNLVSARTLAAMLRFLLEQPMPEPPFTLLPRAGLEGTVSVRQLAPASLGRVFAKDGYIDGASSIAGYVITHHHGPVIFVFLVNDWQQGLDAVWASEDRMLDTIARY
jgi:D-alanyl-D-alanine carboxypeptidase/D-alanyl-D-alanine-endopeptidase (penicillin-binding protein 4)